MATKKKITARKTSAIDTYIGERIRERRHELGVSQGALAEELNMSFQQVQKYEQGTNRVAAATLYHMCAILDVDISYFLPPQKPSDRAAELAAVARAKSSTAQRGAKSKRG